MGKVGLVPLVLKAGGCGEALVAPSYTRTDYTQIYSPIERFAVPAWEHGVSDTSDRVRRAFKKKSAMFNSQTEKQILKADVMAKWRVLPNWWQSEGRTCCKCDASQVNVFSFCSNIGGWGFILHRRPSVEGAEAGRGQLWSKQDCM